MIIYLLVRITVSGPVHCPTIMFFFNLIQPGWY